tara:strand:+ start:9966 stop:10880 length:915 start_codon:yes stop_codon:yes gene_type:complete
MINYRDHNYIDIEKYNNCVQRNNQKIPYALSWYLDSVCEQWDCLVLDDYDAVWPLPFRRKFGIKYFFRPFAIQQLGVFSKQPLSEEQILAFQQKLSENCRFADVYLNENQIVNSLSNKWEVKKQTNLVLKLKRSYQEVYKGYSSNLKRKLKKQQQTNFDLFESDGPQVLLDLFSANKGEELKLSSEFFRSMEKAMFQLLHRGLAKVFTIYGGPNQLLAGVFFVEYQGRSIFLFSAVSPIGKDLDAMTYLINEYLIYNSERLEELDFEGSENKGLARFYASFGPEVRSYNHLKYNGLPWPISLLK